MSASDSSGRMWGSRWGFILAAVGMSIGTGEMWRFPRVVATYGGMSIMVMMFVALIVWCIPILMFEAVLGKTTRMGIIGATGKMVGKEYTWLGTCYAWITLFLTAYYAVVLGWTVRYFVYAVMGTIKIGVDTEALWTAFSTSRGAMVPWWLLGMGVCVFVLWRGVAQGIEKVSKILMPFWFTLLVVLMIRAITLPGGIEGLKYLYAPNWHEFFNPTMWLEAFTQKAWGTAPGLGLMLTYAVYMKSDEDISLNCSLVPFMCTSAAFICGMTVVPTIFAMSPDPMAVVASGNTGMTFIHLTKLFTVMPGGRYASVIFFLALLIAALSSTISMVEMATRIVQDAGINRKKSIIIAGAGLTLLGIPSALDINFLNNQDWVYGIGVLVSGFLVALIAIKLGPKKIWQKYIAPSADLDVPWVFNLIYTAPFMFVAIFGWWLWQASQWYPGEWMKWLPISKYPFTAGTLFYQWGIMLVFSIVTSKWLGKIMVHPLQVDSDIAMDGEPVSVKVTN